MTNRGITGDLVKTVAKGENVDALVPHRLPPEPPIDLLDIGNLLNQANIAIGRLDGISITLPNLPLFLYMYVRKEAVLSSQIEGTQSSLSDLLMFEAEEEAKVPIHDVEEVSNYVAAMNHGLDRIKNDFPLSLRLIREMHEKLLQKGRGSTKQPGIFRKTQNWVGNQKPSLAIHVPTPPNLVEDLMGDLEKFWHDDSNNLPTLVKAAIAHVQFETIHPFLDGNGRLGRLLITFILCIDGLLKEPLLYLSLYFKRNRADYYDHLQEVREKGNWEKWIKFFLIGVIDTSEQAVQTIQLVLKLFQEDEQKINDSEKPTTSILMVYQYLQKFPITEIKNVSEHSAKITIPTATKALKYLEDLGIVKEITGKARNKVYSYTKYLELLNEGTQLD